MALQQFNGDYRPVLKHGGILPCETAAGHAVVYKNQTDYDKQREVAMAGMRHCAPTEFHRENLTECPDRNALVLPPPDVEYVVSSPRQPVQGRDMHACARGHGRIGAPDELRLRARLNTPGQVRRTEPSGFRRAEPAVVTHHPEHRAAARLLVPKHRAPSIQRTVARLKQETLSHDGARKQPRRNYVREPAAPNGDQRVPEPLTHQQRPGIDRRRVAAPALETLRFRRPPLVIGR